MLDLIHDIAIWYISQVERIGWAWFTYLGMLVESSFVPFPSEIVMPPAGHQAGSIPRLLLVIFCGTAGSLSGGLINYSLGYYLGRPFFEKYGKFFLISHKSLEKMDRFWVRHGEAGTFICRFIPGVRQLISLPAGISRMNIWKFSFYTSLGSGIWVTTLALIGWWFRNISMADFIKWSDEQLKGQMMPWLLAAIVLMIGSYVGWSYLRRRREDPDPTPGQ